MHYEGNIIRPPSEANSILLQVTLGCSHNRCGFCGTFLDKKFAIKSDEVIFEDIAFAARHMRDRTRLFLCDGDALIMPQERLLRILEAIRQQLPQVTRVGIYANVKSLKRKSPEELRQLREAGLKIAYLGLETGDDAVLQAIDKGATAEEAIAQGRKARQAGIKLSITVLVGIAGRQGSLEHARQTGRVLSAIDPEFVGALSLMPVPGTPVYRDIQAGRFELLEPVEMLRELREMIQATDLSAGVFHANHASNYLPIRARLPRDKEATLRQIDEALAGRVALRPEWMRGL